MFVVATSLAVGLVTALHPAPAAAVAHDDQTFLTLVNDLRSSRGLGPLVLDGNLSALAASHTAAMAGGAGLTHSGDLSAGVTTRWSRLGENIGYGANVEVIWRAFLNSPEHFANLTDPRFDRVGIATVVGANGIEWTTHRFLQTAATAAALPPAPPSPAAPPTATVPRVVPRVVPPPTVRRPPATAAPLPPTTATQAPTDPPAPPVTQPPPLLAAAPDAAGVAYVLDALHVAG